MYVKKDLFLAILNTKVHKKRYWTKSDNLTNETSNNNNCKFIKIIVMIIFRNN